MLENKPTEENTHNGMKYPSHIEAILQKKIGTVQL